VDAVEPQRLADRADLLDEQLDRPVERLRRRRRLTAADLVVEHRPPAGVGKTEERLYVVVRAARAAVEAERRQLAHLGRARLAVPRVEAAVRDAPLRLFPRFASLTLGARAFGACIGWHAREPSFVRPVWAPRRSRAADACSYVTDHGAPS